MNLQMTQQMRTTSSTQLLLTNELVSRVFALETKRP